MIPFCSGPNAFTFGVTVISGSASYNTKLDQKATTEGYASEEMQIVREKKTKNHKA